MDRRIPIFAALALVGAAGLVWLFLPGDGGPIVDASEPPVPSRELAPAPARADAVGRTVATEAPALDAPPSKGIPFEDMFPDRAPPSTPEQEGLYALLDASGMALARCRLADFPEGANLPADYVVVGEHIEFPTEPAEREDLPDGSFTLRSPAPQIHIAAEAAYSMSLGSAFVGSAPGSCRVTEMHLGDDFRIGGLDGVAAQLQERATAELDDAEEAMLPEQVALDTPGLSQGARAWLQARLDEKLDDAERIEADDGLEERLETEVRAAYGDGDDED